MTDRERKRPAMHILPLVAILAFACSDAPKEQPIAYNHQLHIETAGLTCIDCHTSVESAAGASIPSTEVCSGCHADEPMGASPEEAKLLTHVADGSDVPWQKVYAVPDHVYFSHRRHVRLGEVECKECHGDVASFTAAVSVPFRPVTMENCMDCHRDRNVTNDCLSCHR